LQFFSGEFEFLDLCVHILKDTKRIYEREVGLRVIDQYWFIVLSGIASRAHRQFALLMLFTSTYSVSISFSDHFLSSFKPGSVLSLLVLSF